MSIVDEFTSKYGYGNQQKAVDKLNNVCNKRLRGSELSAMKSGKRGVSSCIHWVMLNECLAKILEDAGYTYKDGVIPAKAWIELIDKITPPEPKK